MTHQDEDAVLAYARALDGAGTITVCYSRCLYCGRQTPHEVCHEHSEAVHPGWWDDIQENVGSDVDPMDLIWRTGRDKEPETCEDGSCPVWEPGEWDHRQKWAAMPPEQRKAETDRINQGIAERRAARESEVPDAAATGARGTGEGG